jgi:hypothetical protein
MALSITMLFVLTLADGNRKSDALKTVSKKAAAEKLVSRV